MELIFTTNKNLERGQEGIKKIEISTKKGNRKEEKKVDKAIIYDYIGVMKAKKGKTMQKNKKDPVKVDIRSENSAYITIGKWVIYIDNSTGEQIIDSWEE